MPTLLPVNANDFLKKATAIAPYYGFTPIDERVAAYAKGRRMYPLPETRADVFGAEMARILETYRESAGNASASEERAPSLWYHGSIAPHRKRTPTECEHRMHFSLVALNMQPKTAEALLIRTASTILEETGFANRCVYINSIGDKDSGAKFAKELHAFMRQNIAHLPVSGQTILKRDLFQALAYLRCKRHPICNDMPKPVGFLSGNSRKYFQEVLEHLEAVNVPYMIDDGLVGHNGCYRETIFEIRSADTARDDAEHALLARGGRYDELARRLAGAPMSAFGIMICCPWKRKSTDTPLPRRKQLRPKHFFIQLGPLAKQQSLSVIEHLRKANIPLHHMLHEDTLGAQLAEVKRLELPYAIIFGQKEALENAVIVRDMDTHAQEAVPIATLPEYLKNLQ